MRSNYYGFGFLSYYDILISLLGVIGLESWVDVVEYILGMSFDKPSFVQDLLVDVFQDDVTNETNEILASQQAGDLTPFIKENKLNYLFIFTGIFIMFGLLSIRMLYLGEEGDCTFSDLCTLDMLDFISNNHWRLIYGDSVKLLDNTPDVDLITNFPTSILKDNISDVTIKASDFK